MTQAESLATYRKALEAAHTQAELEQAIVNAPFKDLVEAARLFLGIVVLLRANPTTQMIDRIALSNTSLAKGTVKMSVKKFEDIKIPVGYHDNIIAEALSTGRPTQTTDWRYLFEPALTAQEARFNQAGGGIAFSAVYPITAVKPPTAMIFSYFQYAEHVGESQRKFMDAYTQLVAEKLLKSYAA